MLNFKACGTLLNIMQSSKYFAQNFFIMIGTTSKGGTVKLVTFIFPPLAKGHPNIYVYIYMYRPSDQYIYYAVAIEKVYWNINGIRNRIRESRLPENYNTSAHVLDILLLND